MGILKAKTGNSEKSVKSDPDKSMYISDSKIDRDGVAWKKKGLWIREEHLGKLKVIGHFKQKKTNELVDEAISKYISQSWDNSMAIEKMVKGEKQ